MKSYRQLSLILLAGICTSFAFGMLRGGTTVATYAWGPDAPQWSGPGPAERDLRRISWRLQARLAEEAVGPGTASVLRRGPGGTLLILDHRSREIRAVDPATDSSGSLARTEGPILDFGSDAAGGLWWVEEGNRRLLRRSSHGERTASSPLPEAPHRVALGPDGSFVALSADAGPHLFHSYFPGGGPATAFGNFLEGGLQEPLVLEGSLASLPGGGFVYAPHYLPFLAAFSHDGRRLFRRPLAGTRPGPAPSVVRGPRDSRAIAPGTRVQAYSVHVTGGGLIALVAPPEGRSRGPRLLDLYGGDDGEYLYTFELPEGARDALLSGGELFTLHRDGIRRWKPEPPSELPPEIG